MIIRFMGESAVNGQVEVSAGGRLKVPVPRVGSAGFPGAASSCSGLFHPVGVAVGDDDVAVVQEPVQHADGGGVLGQEPAPGLERPVGSDAQRPSFVGGGDEPEQQLGSGVIERSEAELVADDQVVAEQGLDRAADGVVG
jgi:hypothetical protein